ncbi:TPA: restriction endonuclease subunit S [Streptococcus suis]|nr:restriction endonuclease subunit S [Streptococcus suis]
MPNKERNIPKRRFKEFENADAWELRKLGEVAEIVMGQSPDSKNYTDNPLDNILVQGNADLRDGCVVPRVWTTQVTKTAEKGDLILSVRAPVGDVGRTNYNVVLGRGVAGIKGNEFIYHLLVKMKLFGYWTKLSTGSTFESINSDDIKNSIILFPSHPEQEAIGTFFSTLDRHITLHQRKLDKLKSVKQAYLSEMFPAEGERVPKRRFPGFTDAWELRPLGEIGNTYTGLSGKTKDDFGHGDGRFVTYMNVFSNPISLPEMVEAVEIDESQNTVRYGDVLFTTSSETPEEVGMSSVWLENTENTYLNSFCFGFRPVKKVNPYYLAYLLRSSGMRRKISFLAQGISRYNISKTKMMELEISIPNEKEQSAIGSFFSTLDQHITLHQRKLEKLKNLKKALLNELFV